MASPQTPPAHPAHRHPEAKKSEPSAGEKSLLRSADEAVNTPIHLMNDDQLAAVRKYLDARKDISPADKELLTYAVRSAMDKAKVKGSDGSSFLEDIKENYIQRRQAYDSEQHDNAPHATDGVVAGLNLAGGIIGATGVGIPIEMGIRGLATLVDGIGSAAHHDSPERQREVWKNGALNVTPLGAIIAAKNAIEGQPTDLGPTQNRLACRNMPELARAAAIDCSKFITGQQDAQHNGGMPTQLATATPAAPSVPTRVTDR